MDAIKLREVKKVFRNSLSTHTPTVAFRIADLSVEEGEQVALTGPSGCGKTTLLHLIAGLATPDEGSIEVEGVRVDQLSPSERDRFRGQRVGVVFQDHNLIPALSAIDNVILAMRFGRNIPRMHWHTRAREALDRVSLGHRRRFRPDQLSIGEQQRVAIARTLANQPNIILADEPTGSLDPGTGAQVFTLLQEICAETNHTLLVVTHDESVWRRMSRRLDCSGLVHESDMPQ